MVLIDWSYKLKSIYLHFLAVPVCDHVQLSALLGLDLSFFKKFKGEAEGASLANLTLTANLSSELGHDHLGDIQTETDSLRVER